MKNLWRIVILFSLPGAVLGGNAIAAFYRLTDGAFEPLMTVCAAATAWSITAYLISQVSLKICKRFDFYYFSIAITSALIAILPGIAIFFSGNGLIAAFTGIIISAAAAACVTHSFADSKYNIIDRGCFIAGIFASMLIWGYAACYSRLAWMETLFFYLALFLLLCWAFASPLTVYGTACKKILWRTLLVLGAIGGFFVVPVFSPPPNLPCQSADSEKLWKKTYTTINGRRFLLTLKNGRYGYYTPSGRLLMQDKADETLAENMPFVLSMPDNERIQIDLIAPYTSVLPRAIRDFSPAGIRHYRLPEAMFFRKNSWKHQRPAMLLDSSPQQHNFPETDILLITALPENQYPEFLQNFLKHFTGKLKNTGMAVIPASLLKNAAVFSFMHERFQYRRVLPGADDLWIFSNRQLNFSAQTVSKKLQKLLGSYQPFSSDIYEVIYSDNALRKKSPSTAGLEKIHLGSNKWTGSWWWLLPAAAVALLWRGIRLFGERYNTMYSWFNAAENGFSGMGIFLLGISFLLVNTGAYTLLLSILAVSFCVFFCKWKAGGVFAALIGIMLLPAVQGHFYNNLWLIPLMLQAIALTGAIPSAIAQNTAAERKLQCAVFLGMMLASLSVAAVWIFNMPLLLIWGMIFIARLPGIWQYSRKRVYYKQ